MEFNVARHLRFAAQNNPGFCAVRVPVGRTGAGDIRYIERTFAELDRESDAAAEFFRQHGIVAGARTLLLARPGLDLILSMFALLKLGAVPIAIDPGMGFRSFLRCVENVRPEAVVGVRAALWATRFFPGKFSGVRARVTVGTNRFSKKIREIAGNFSGAPREIFAAEKDALAAILFTSGSTGAPKGVRYAHGMFDAQLAFVRDAYGILPGEVDLPMLPVFALFNPALGTTTVTPEMNPARPAAVDSEKIVRAVRQNAVTYSFGSPALWTKIARYCEAQKITLPTLRRVLIAGAPVHPRLFAALKEILPNAEIFSPYGATEVLPVSSISATEVLGETFAQTTQGRGTCVGRPLAGVRVSVIRIRDNAIENLADAEVLPAGEVGEIIVQSASCTREYDNNPGATALAKIRDGDSGKSFWHRMGDLGRIDAAGRIWFYGRKAERVETAAGTLYTECCEAIFNTHPNIFRSALIGLGEPGRQMPAIVVEPWEKDFPATPAAKAQFSAELNELAGAHAITAGITRFYFEKKFPVDVRHNAKIHRLTLRKKYAAVARF